jgi:hypothetical protein
MVGLRYVRIKLGRLRCGGLDTVQDLLKTVEVLHKPISQSKKDLFQNAHCKERMMKLCTPGRNTPSRLVYSYTHVVTCSHFKRRGTQKNFRQCNIIAATNNLAEYPDSKQTTASIMWLEFFLCEVFPYLYTFKMLPAKVVSCPQRT